MENSIEEDIARIAKLITTKFNNDYSIDNKDKEALEHILSDYKRVLKENEELKEAYKSEKKMKNEYVKLYQDLLLKENVIPVQKVKDEKEKLDKKYNELVDKVYKDPLKALTDFQRVVGGQAILNALLKEGET